MTSRVEDPLTRPAWLAAVERRSDAGGTWVDQLQILWEEHLRLTAEAEALRLRLASVEEQLVKRAGAMTKAEELYEMLREMSEDEAAAVAPSLMPPPATPVGPAGSSPAPESAGHRRAPELAQFIEAGRLAEPAQWPLTVAGVGDSGTDTTEAPARRRLFPSRRVATRMARVAGAALGGLVLVAMLFLSVGPRVLPYQTLVVRSGSMSPTMPTGSLVLYRRAAATQIKVGDVIAFAKPGNPDERVTHRVYKIGQGPNGRYFETKGDANGAPDAWKIAAVGTGWVAFAHVSGVGYALGYLQTPAARMLLIVIPALLLGGITLVEIWRPKRDGDRLAPA